MFGIAIQALQKLVTCHVDYAPTGSRVICPDAVNPASDWDILVRCESPVAEARWREILEAAGFTPHSGPENSYGVRKGTPPSVFYGTLPGMEGATVNVVLKRPCVFTAWWFATRECKALHQGGVVDLSSRDIRVAVFAAIRKSVVDATRPLWEAEGYESHDRGFTPHVSDLPSSTPGSGEADDEWDDIPF